jgi:hypothetical protein
VKKAKCPYGEHDIRLPDEIDIDDQVRCPIDFRDAIVVRLGPPVELCAIEGEPGADFEEPPVDPPPHSESPVSSKPPKPPKPPGHQH